MTTEQKLSIEEQEKYAKFVSKLQTCRKRMKETKNSSKYQKYMTYTSDIDSTLKNISKQCNLIYSSFMKDMQTTQTTCNYNWGLGGASINGVFRTDAENENLMSSMAKVDCIALMTKDITTFDEFDACFKNFEQKINTFLSYLKDSTSKILTRLKKTKNDNNDSPNDNNGNGSSKSTISNDFKEIDSLLPSLDFTEMNATNEANSKAIGKLKVCLYCLFIIYFFLFWKL